ncbi:mycofactocin-coupled SDR family oxidoreductase [Rhodococcus qingshengii]|uniref:mycofactocin-coupled SDR family oxidoreductase n=1 Tax=Rhodococcus qingshengii TaxID=334542 RepID=UPI0010A5CF74|nr:mycofactocin-coupled SDR family oxidoreductase [Rhodococcus qingshengii]THJ67672.1 NAD(P)-dependent oxidoreductase [Rhodococcus qingshengii]
MEDLNGKIALITGAARGQGRSHAVELARHGADIIAVDICSQIAGVPYPMASREDLDETVRQVEALDRRVFSSVADVRDLAELTRVVDEGVAELGGLDIIIANAGISAPAPTLEMSDDDWSTMIDVNLSGVWRTVRAGTPYIVAGGKGGSIVMISSLAAMMPNNNIAHYAAAKAGLVAFMKVLAKEQAPNGIRVNTVHPTTVATDMVLNDATYKLFRPDRDAPTRDEFEAAARTLNALPVALTESVDITNAILYLVSDTGRYVTGTTHVVDAGGAL